MMKPRYIWPAFAACLLLVAGVLGWATLTVVRLDEAQVASARQASVEERVRLALWRMDSAMGPVIAQESSRPYYTYSAFYTDENTSEFNAQSLQGKTTPSPLLTKTPQHILLHFQIGPGGQLTSPQIPSDAAMDRAAMAGASPDSLPRAKELLAGLQPLVFSPAVKAALERKDDQPLLSLIQYAKPRARQDSLNLQEAVARNQMVIQNAARPEATTAPVEVRGSQLRPLWVGQRLVLVRQVEVGKSKYVQGAVLDWDELSSWLTGTISDLLPSAKLLPSPVTAGGAGEDATADVSRMLASLPVRLLPGDVPAVAAGPSPVWWSLVIAWACVVAAAVGAAWLLAGALRLSERRGAFASAVTHELRTPLTTFRMYCEMLSGGMVADEAKRGEYLAVMCRESERLSHLVENVLAFAHIEGSRAPVQLQDVDLGQLIERNRARLLELTARVGLALELQTPAEHEQATALASASAVEQIVINLVDNACKYASGGSGRRLCVSVGADGAAATIRVRDNGPGIDRRQRGKLFKPFAKSSAEAANSATGVGLGLALSRRMALTMGGDLRLDASVKDGACFVLELSAASRKEA